MATNHAGWIVERLTTEGWIPCSHILKTKDAAKFVMHAFQRYDSQTEFRIYEALK